MVEQSIPCPVEFYVDIISPMSDFDAPKEFGDKVFDPEIPVHNKSEGRELTRSYSL